MAKHKISRFTIRTSDRRVFRRCLRKWDWLSSMRMNLQRQGTEQNINFWFGSAIHFAMEDYFGYNRFNDPRRAFKAYYEAFDANTRPEGASVHYDLGIAMLTYFMDWYPKHNRDWQFETLWLTNDLQPVPPGTEGAHPAVEQTFFLDLGIQVIVSKKTDRTICEYDLDMENEGSSTWPLIKREKVNPFDPESEELIYFQQSQDADWQEVYLVPIHYHGTVDRVCIDKYGRWWILDYKTAKGADTNKLDTDDQISAYLWAMEQILKHKIYGFIYLQLTKDVAKLPKRLKDGTYSVDKKQKTTYTLAKEAFIEEYGSIQKVPNKYIEFLNILAEKETPEGDRFIRWDFVQRSDNQILTTYNHIMGEVRTMLNPNIYLYPNPTRDCIWDCPIRDLCIAMDDGRINEVNTAIEMSYESRPREEDNQDKEDWRQKLKWPDTVLGPADPEEFKMDLEDFEVMLPDEYVDNFGFDKE